MYNLLFELTSPQFSLRYDWSRCLHTVSSAIITIINDMIPLIFWNNTGIIMDQHQSNDSQQYNYNQSIIDNNKLI